MPSSRRPETQDPDIPGTAKQNDSDLSAGKAPGQADQAHHNPAQRRTREQTAAGSRRLRSGATVANADGEDQLMSLDEYGKPVLAGTSGQKAQDAKASSSATPPSPRTKSKATASVNKAMKAKPTALEVSPDQADSPSPPQAAPAASTPPDPPDDAPTQPIREPVQQVKVQRPAVAARALKGQVPAKVSSPRSPRSPRQPASPSERKTRAGAEAAAAADKVRQEDAILERAEQIYESRNTKQLPAFPEPKRPKVHWDHVLEEMQWMAKEFAKERRWKIAQAKRFAKLVSKSNLDVEGRERTRRKEELQNVKRRAAWVAKEAMQFWRKAERVVQYKQQTVSNARKKEVMDKHLDFLVGQTQRYSTLLAQRLAGAADSQAVPALPAPQMPAQPLHQQLIKPDEATLYQQAQQAEAEQSDTPVQLPSTSAARAEAGQADETEPMDDEEELEPDIAQLQADSDAQSDGGASSSAEYGAGVASEEDDEATLEEEEALSRAEGGTKNELSSLEAEADMPLEQLLAQYGYDIQNGTSINHGGPSLSQPQADAAPSTSRQSRRKATEQPSPADRPSKRQRTDTIATPASAKASPSHTAHPARHVLVAAAASESDEASGSETDSGDLRSLMNLTEPATADASATDASNGPAANRPAALGALTSSPSEEGDDLQSGSDFGSAGSGDEDDEQTLEEEERLAQAEGSNQDAAELADLEDEANMPLEQLLARYGYASSTPTAAAPSKPPQPIASQSTRPQGASNGAESDPSKPKQNPVRQSPLPAKQQEVQGSASHAETHRPHLDNGIHATKGDAEADTEAQAHQAAAAGMDAFEHSQALAERRASGSQAGPSHAAVPTPGLASRARPSTTGKAQIAAEVANAAAEGPPPAASPNLKRPSPLAAKPKATKGSSTPSKDDNTLDGKAQLEDVAKLANDLQPTGSSLATTTVHTKVPFLLKHGLREYQHIGLDWLMTIYTRRLNGILADEMGLGKTIMTISLLAHLACEKGDWGPHLIVVPTSVMLNWEMEFKKWCPAFKLLTYFGSAKERKLKRHGWSKPNAFHICITSYTLVLQDAKMFRRKKWKYLILDEAHMIKNWKSQRWQTLLNFNSKRRLLITGTPLQNDLMELWSLMHFLMPQIFASHAQFKDWFNNPLVGMVEGQQDVNKGIVERLHSVLRPFLLRRLKCDVEKQLPQKKEHVIRCRLSKRQRTLYEDYMASSDTSATLSSSNFLGIINVLMQLRKVCNHPDLFEGRPIVSSFDMFGFPFHLPSVAMHAFVPSLWQNASLVNIHADILAQEDSTCWAAQETQALAASLEQILAQMGDLSEHIQETDESLGDFLGFTPSREAMAAVQGSVHQQAEAQQQWALSRLQHAAMLTQRRCCAVPMYGQDLRKAVSVQHPVAHVHIIASQPNCHLNFSSAIAAAVQTPSQRATDLDHILKQFMFVIPQARSPPPTAWCSHPDQSIVLQAARHAQLVQQEWVQRSAVLRPAIVRQQLFFPDRQLLQFDCGKLQELAVLLHRLKTGGHKALIFTQMTKMLDVLEAFLNLHGYIYLRLDGSTKPEQRQILMQRFNTNPKIFIFILSTRSGGVGMNLTGADTVIFYDSDWNPAMDAQAQDRCHRIGQTREVHIYRLVSEKTIEENILVKSDQKRQLDHLAIQSGGFNTEVLHKFNPRDLLGIKSAGGTGGAQSASSADVSAEQVQAAMRSVEDETDAAAAAALEQENAAELAEFTLEPAAQVAKDAAGDEGEDAEEDELDQEDARDNGAARDREPSVPVSTSTGAEPDRPGPSSQAATSTALVPLAAAEEDEMMQDVAQMAGGGQASGQDALTKLDTTLRPIEKYAVRFLEMAQEQAQAEMAAALEAEEMQVQEQEWNMAELERIQEQQEADMDEEGDVDRAAHWDLAAADAAYKAQVEAALAQQQADEEEARKAWERLERQAAAAAAAAAARAEEDQKQQPVVIRPTRRPAVKPLRLRDPSSSEESEEEDSPSTRYRGSRLVGRHDMDADRPLGRGLRYKQEPVWSYSSAFARDESRGQFSPSAKRRRTHMGATSNASRLGRTSRPTSAEDALEESGGPPGAARRAAARPPDRFPTLIRAPAKLTARGAPVQIWQPWEAAEDLVICAVVHSSMTAASVHPADPPHPTPAAHTLPSQPNPSGNAATARSMATAGAAMLPPGSSSSAPPPVQPVPPPQSKDPVPVQGTASSAAPPAMPTAQHAVLPAQTSSNALQPASTVPASATNALASRGTVAAPPASAASALEGSSQAPTQKSGLGALVPPSLPSAPMPMPAMPTDTQTSNISAKAVSTTSGFQPQPLLTAGGKSPVSGALGVNHIPITHPRPTPGQGIDSMLQTGASQVSGLQPHSQSASVSHPLQPAVAGQAQGSAAGPMPGTAVAPQRAAAGSAATAVASHVGNEVWQLASDVLAAGGTSTTVAAVSTAAQQAKKRTAGDCRARFCMLMRAQRAAKTPGGVPAPSTANAAMHAQSHTAPLRSSLPPLSAPQGNPLGLPAPHANMLATAQAPQARPAAATAHASASAVAVPPAQGSVPQPAPATQTHALPATNTMPATAQQLLSSSSTVPASVAQLSGATPSSSKAAGMPTAGLPSFPGTSASLLPPVAGHNLNPMQIPLLPPSTGAATATLAYLLAAKAGKVAATGATAGAPPGAVASTAVAGGGRSMRLLHRSSADVLQVKLKLVDLVQGSAALQPKELSATFESALTAAAQEGQNKPQSPLIPPRPSPVAPTNSTSGSPSQGASAHSPAAAVNSPGAVASGFAPAASGPQVPAGQLQGSSAGQVQGAPSFLRPGPSPLGPSAPVTGQVRTLGPAGVAVSGVGGLAGAWHAAGAPSVVAGAQKTMEELQQLAESDPEAIIDLIHSARTAESGSPAGVQGTSIAVASQEQKQHHTVEVVLQEATEILTAASKGCGSFAKPILRHVTAVAEAVKKDGVQAANEMLLQLLQLPKAQPQPVITHLHPQQQHARPAILAHQSSSGISAAALAQHHAPGLLNSRLHAPQQAMQSHLSRPQLQQPLQQQAQQASTRPSALPATASASLPLGGRVVQLPQNYSSQAQASAGANLAPHAVQITAANLPFASQPTPARPQPDEAAKPVTQQHQQQPAKME